MGGWRTGARAQPADLPVRRQVRAPTRSGRTAPPRYARDKRRKHGPVEVEITVTQRFPTFPVVHSDRSDGHFAGDVAPTIIRSMKPSGIVSVLDFGRWVALIMP